MYCQNNPNSFTLQSNRIIEEIKLTTNPPEEVAYERKPCNFLKVEEVKKGNKIDSFKPQDQERGTANF